MIVTHSSLQTMLADMAKDCEKFSKMNWHYALERMLFDCMLFWKIIWYRYEKYARKFSFVLSCALWWRVHFKIEMTVHWFVSSELLKLNRIVLKNCCVMWRFDSNDVHHTCSVARDAVATKEGSSTCSFASERPPGQVIVPGSKNVKLW